MFRLADINQNIKGLREDAPPSDVRVFNLQGKYLRTEPARQWEDFRNPNKGILRPKLAGVDTIKS